MQYLHTMVRVKDLDASLHFYCNLLGLEEISRKDSEKGRFTLVFLAAPDDRQRALDDRAPMVELTYNWDPEDYDGGRNFGHLAYRVDGFYPYPGQYFYRASAKRRCLTTSGALAGYGEYRQLVMQRQTDAIIARPDLAISCNTGSGRSWPMPLIS